METKDPATCPHENVTINSDLVRTEDALAIHHTYWCADCKMIFGVPGLNNGICTDVPTTSRNRTLLMVPLWGTDGRVNTSAGPEPPKPRIYTGN